MEVKISELLISHQAVGLLKLLCSTSQWAWGDSTNYFVAGNRKRDPISGECVYFVKSDSREGQIKIGRTSNIRDRMRQISSTENKSDLLCIAICHCGRNELMESLLHEMLKHFRIDGEWFDEAATRALLDEITFTPTFNPKIYAILFGSSSEKSDETKLD